MSENENSDRVRRYYHLAESRWGYRLLLGGTKHFGWYEPGQSRWRFAAAMRRMEEELGRHLDLPAGSAVLDAGCGVGDVARTMATRFGLNVTGVDVLNFNIEIGRRRSAAAGLSELTRFYDGDYHELAFDAGRFDGAYTMETLVHAADPQRALAELHRVVRPGGRLVSFEYSRRPDDLVSPAARLAIRRVSELAAMPAWYGFVPGRLEELMRDAGFVVLGVTDVTQRMLPMLHAFATLGRLPYFVSRRIGHADKVVNALSGVEMWRHRAAWRYNIYVAAKPPPTNPSPANPSPANPSPTNPSPTNPSI